MNSRSSKSSHPTTSSTFLFVPKWWARHKRFVEGKKNLQLFPPYIWIFFPHLSPTFSSSQSVKSSNVCWLTFFFYFLINRQIKKKSYPKKSFDFCGYVIRRKETRRGKRRRKKKKKRKLKKPASKVIGLVIGELQQRRLLLLFGFHSWTITQCLSFKPGSYSFFSPPPFPSFSSFPHIRI